MEQGNATHEMKKTSSSTDASRSPVRAGPIRPHSKVRILIVEDEPAMVAALRDNFEYDGFDVVTAADGRAGLEQVYATDPDLVLLDVMMPHMSGLEVCKAIRSSRPSLPIIMLTARGQEIDKVVGLELGADDYVTKPFSVRELIARVRTVLRRAERPAQLRSESRFGDVTVDLRGTEVRRAGKRVDLSIKEFSLLAYLIAHAGETLSRDRLLNDVWGQENYPSTRTIDTHIAHLRQKLEARPENPRFIVTVHGMGYKFVEEGSD
jgi:DNA-binding response OmpR family regulator